MDSLRVSENRKYILFINRGANASNLAPALKEFGLDNVLVVYVDNEPHTQILFQEVAA